MILYVLNKICLTCLKSCCRFMIMEFSWPFSDIDLFRLHCCNEGYVTHQRLGIILMTSLRVGDGDHTRVGRRAWERSHNVKRPSELCLRKSNLCTKVPAWQRCTLSPFSKGMYSMLSPQSAMSYQIICKTKAATN